MTALRWSAIVPSAALVDGHFVADRTSIELMRPPGARLRATVENQCRPARTMLNAGTPVPRRRRNPLPRTGFTMPLGIQLQLMPVHCLIGQCFNFWCGIPQTPRAFSARRGSGITPRYLFHGLVTISFQCFFINQRRPRTTRRQLHALDPHGIPLRPVQPVNCIVGLLAAVSGVSSNRRPPLRSGAR